MKKINIAFFTDSYKPNKDGVVVAIELLRKYLKHYKGFVKLIVCPKNDNDKFIEIEDGTKIIKVGGIPLPFYKDYVVAFITSSFAATLMKEEKINMLHSHGIGFTALSSVIAAKKIGIKSIITFHTNVLQATHYLGIFEKPIRYFLTLYIRYLLNLYDVVIVPSKKIKRLLKNIGVKKNIFIIPTGIEVSDVANNKRDVKKEKELKKIKGKSIVILFVEE